MLGPLLLNIFQNDLSYNLDSGLSMYADDHQIYVKGKDMYTIVAKLQESNHSRNKLARFESSSGKPEKIPNDEHSE